MASLSCLRLGRVRPSVARLEPSTMTWCGITLSVKHLGTGPRTILRMFTAVLWDFGGVILSSPFEAFNHYEARTGLPLDFIRGVNATNPDSNAWARLERNEIGPAGFDEAFADDS